LAAIKKEVGMKAHENHPLPRVRRLFTIALIGKMVSFSLLRATAVQSQVPAPVPVLSPGPVAVHSSQEISTRLANAIAGYTRRPR
jgi:hypothetical protein